MSLNQLVLDEFKEWLNIRVNNLQVDGSELGRVETGTINWTGAITNSSNYRAEILGNTCILRLDINSDNAVAAANILSSDFPASLVPSGSGIAQDTAIVENNSNRVLGTWNITGAGEMQIQTINPANNQGTTFFNSGNAGWTRPIICVYQLDQ